MEKIGVIEEVSMKKKFENEENFSRYLNEHIDLLSEKIEIDLIKGDTETPVGMYRCDIVTGFVVIENKLGKSDHDHIGKLLTYFSNQDVKVGILICEEPTAEHERTFQWLNDHRNEDEYFFLLKVRAIRVGNSKIGIDLIVRVKPEISKLEKSKRKFGFTPMLTELRRKFEELKPEARMAPLSNVQKIRTGKSRLHFEWNPKGSRRDKVLEIGLHIETNDEVYNERLLEHLRPYKAELEHRIGDEVYYGKWGRKKKESTWRRISVDRKFKFKDQLDKELIEWAVQTMSIMYEVLIPKLGR